MNILNVDALQKSYGGRRIFDGVSFAIDEAEKVGFIGVNGSGKSTLFRIVAGFEGADAGRIALRRGATVRYLSQEPEFAPGQTILDAVAEGRPQLRAVFAEYETVMHALSAADTDHDRLIDRQAELTATIDRLNGWDWTHRAEAMLTQLGVVEWERSMGDLSGVVDRMIEVSAGQLKAYAGGYTEYLEAQATRVEWQATVDAKRRRLIEQELDWARRSPPARTGKSRARMNARSRWRRKAGTTGAGRPAHSRFTHPILLASAGPC